MRSKTVVDSANGSQTDHEKRQGKGTPNIDVLAHHSLSRNSEPSGLRRNQSFNLQLATSRELMAINPFHGTYSRFGLECKTGQSRPACYRHASAARQFPPHRGTHLG